MGWTYPRVRLISSSPNKALRPTDLSAMVYLAVHGSFECQPIFGNREQLQELTVTVEQLLDRSAKDFRE